MLKKEIIYWYFYPTRESARQEVLEYIEVYYNRQHAQKRLGYISPIQFPDQWVKEHQQKVA